MAGTIQFIPKAGACLLSKNIIEGKGRVRWMVRETSKVPVDNGWRIFSHIDDSAYLANPNNLQVVDFNQACMFEPALIGIWDFPVGSDLQITEDENGIHVVDTPTGQEIPRERFFVPPDQRA
ncbi:MAG: DUF2185 domain-containing protein [Propionibacteriaceae bacterium]|jgi:hypothetical protein|nr:DUF2185 domain-containing protein [Propionibacteriaceae bacterium]